LRVRNNIKAKIDELPVVYSNPSPIVPTVLDTPPPDGLQAYLEKIIVDAVTAEEGRLFLGAVVAVVFGGILLKWL
jgi:hypothetical protein